MVKIKVLDVEHFVELLTSEIRMFTYTFFHAHVQSFRMNKQEKREEEKKMEISILFA